MLCCLLYMLVYLFICVMLLGFSLGLNCCLVLVDLVLTCYFVYVL